MSGASKASVAAVEAAGGVVRIPAPKADAKKPTKRAKQARAGRDAAEREETEQARRRGGSVIALAVAAPRLFGRDHSDHADCLMGQVDLFIETGLLVRVTDSAASTHRRVERLYAGGQRHVFAIAARA